MLMKRMLNKQFVVMVILCSFIIVLWSHGNVTAGFDFTLLPPVRTADLVEWDTVLFGAYPSDEIKPGNPDYEELKTAFHGKAGDYEVNGVRYRAFTYKDIQTTIHFYDPKGQYYCYEDSKKTPILHIFKFEPIRWRVLEIDGETAFLLADKVLDSGLSMSAWHSSEQRYWLNGQSDSYDIDYSSPKQNFMDTAFTGTEQSYLTDSIVQTPMNPFNRVKGSSCADTVDKIFILSDRECYGSLGEQYGFASSAVDKDFAGLAEPTEYAWAKGALKTSAGFSPWRLRTVVQYATHFDYISETMGNIANLREDGDSYKYISDTKRWKDCNDVGIRPVLRVNWKAAAQAGVLQKADAVSVDLVSGIISSTGTRVTQKTEETPDVPSKPEKKPEETPDASSEPEKKPEETPSASSEPEKKPEETPGASSKPEKEPEETPGASSEPEKRPEETPSASSEPEREPEEIPSASSEPEREPEEIPSASSEPEKEPEETPGASPDIEKGPVKTPNAPEATRMPEKEPNMTPKVTQKPDKMSSASLKATQKPEESPNVTPKTTQKPEESPDVSPEVTQKPEESPDVSPEVTQRPEEGQSVPPKTTQEPSGTSDTVPEPTPELEVVPSVEEIRNSLSVSNIHTRVDFNNHIILTWRKNSLASTYQIYRSTRKNTGYRWLQNVSAGRSQYVDKNVVPNKVYYYKVRVLSNRGYIAYYGRFSSVQMQKTQLLKRPDIHAKKSIKNGQKYIVVKLGKYTADSADIYIRKAGQTYKKVKFGAGTRKTDTRTFWIRCTGRKTRYYIKARTYCKQKRKRYYSGFSKQVWLRA